MRERHRHVGPGRGGLGGQRVINPQAEIVRKAAGDDAPQRNPGGGEPAVGANGDRKAGDIIVGGDHPAMVTLSG